MKSITFRGKKYFVGKQISKSTKKHIGFFFNKIVEEGIVTWYFIGIENNWLIENSYAEYYTAIIFSDNNISSFDDSVEPTEDLFDIPGLEDSYYYKATTLSDTLKEL